MDRLAEKRRLIKQAIQESPHYRYGSKSCDMETVCVFDEIHDHYMLLRLGWEGVRHVRYTTLHVRIKDDKIWIEEDWTEEGIANALMNLGVLKEEIVLGFQPPSMRPYTDFAAV